MSKQLISKERILSAHSRISEDVIKTPLVHSAELSKRTGANVFLKLEFLQNTGSFKVRGASNKISGLSKEDLTKTLVAASTGNHAAAFAHVVHKRKLDGVLYLPENVSRAKLEALSPYNLDIRHFGTMCLQTEGKAAEHAQITNGVLVHPYNDEDIIAGQGTVGIEIEDQLPDVEVVIAPIGGGGLISGLASYFADTNIKVIGAQPLNAAEMHDSVKAGHVVPPSDLDTIADATAGGIEDASITFQICKQLLERIDLCSEEELKQAIAFMVQYHQTIVEPGAALGIATLMNSDRYKGQNVVIVLTGKKINTHLLIEILTTYGSNN